MAISDVPLSTDRTTPYYLLMAAGSILMILASALFTQVGAHGKPESIYYVAAAAIVLSSVTFLLRPFTNLLLCLVYLISPIPMVLDLNYSAIITTLLICNCFFGCVLANKWRQDGFSGANRILLLFVVVGVFGALYGIARGCRVSAALGDLYQLTEFSALFMLGRILIKTDQQFCALVQIIMSATIFACVLQSSDAILNAEYLPHGVQDWPRTINMNAPIAFVLMAALFPSSRNKRWILVGVAVLLINLIWSFTRGLWMATAVSMLVLIFIEKGPFRRALFKFVFVLCAMAIPALYAIGVGSVIEDRIEYTARQFSGVSTDEQGIAERRALEYLLILPKVAEHPIVGHGLGATFEISGSAITQGPKGLTIDFHYIHNLYLSIAFRLGVPMLLLFLALLWLYFRRALQSLGRCNVSLESSLLRKGLIAAMFGEVILSITSPTLLNHPTAGLLGCIMAITSRQFDTDILAAPTQAGSTAPVRS